MTALLVLSFVVGLSARSWGRAAAATAVLIGLRLAWFIFAAVAVTREGPGDLAQMLGYIVGLLAIGGLEIAMLVFLAAGLRRSISGAPRGPAERRADAADGAT